jgi:serine/threonine protein kinase
MFLRYLQCADGLAAPTSRAGTLCSRSQSHEFEGATLVEKITRIRQGTPEKPTKYQMSIPSQFEGIVLKLLEKRPEDRYQTAEDLLADLERMGRFQGVKV